jgi:hypothetical protein
MRTQRFVMILSAALAASASVGCSKHHGAEASAESDKESFGRLTIEQLETRIADAKAGTGKLAIYDNNHRDVFDKGHIPTAKWVDFKDVKASDLPADKETALVFYCANEH